MFWLYSAYTDNLNKFQKAINPSYWQKLATTHLLPSEFHMEYTPTHTLIEFPPYTFPEYVTIEDMVYEANKTVNIDDLEETKTRMWRFEWTEVPLKIKSKVQFDLFQKYNDTVYGAVQWPGFLIRLAGDRISFIDVRKWYWFPWGIICSELGYIAIELVCEAMIESNVPAMHKYQQLLKKLHEWNRNLFHTTDFLNVLYYGQSLGILIASLEPPKKEII